MKLLLDQGVARSAVARLQNVKGPATAELVALVIEAACSDLDTGAVVASDGERIRVRRLPIELGRAP